jgi:CheY-like chemotaxis protein/two-component sensor histidine kinase
VALRDADRRKDEFLAILAHELRNPLAPIRNSLHILRLLTEQDADAKQLTELMERQVNHMVRLIDDLLEVSRITSGKIELRKEAIEIASLVRTAVETSRPLIEAAGHQLVVALPPEPLTLQGDPVRLAQVFANLLNNAAKYTEAGGRIWFTIRREGASATISVRDTGVGIPSDMLPRVFDLFRQIDRHAGQAQGGLGTDPRETGRIHGGTVNTYAKVMDRQRVRGSSADGGAIRWQPEERDQFDPALLKASLVVDDNRDAAESLGMLLTMLGATVHVSYSGADALKALATHRPSVVLLDIGMPEMDGYEVARRIRELPDFRDVTLIALTGWGQEKDRRRSRRAGFDFHLTKPANVDALETLLVSLEGRA